MTTVLRAAGAPGRAWRAAARRPTPPQASVCEHRPGMDAVVKIALTAVLALLACAAPAAAASLGRYDQCGATGSASVVSVTGASCESAREVAAALVAEPAAESGAVLRAAGWTPLRAQDAAGGDFDVVATRGYAALRIRRTGAAPDLDGWSAGRELLFARGRLVGGARPPSGTVLCTSAFLIMLRGHPGGLSAAHCGGVRKDGTTQRRNAALRRPPQPGIVLGGVQRNLARTRPLDALVVPVPSGASRPSAGVVDRGVARPPWFVAGAAQPTPQRRVCYSGRTSGIDQCGVILSGAVGRRIARQASRAAGTRVICTSIIARSGDSGGPVYTRPRSDGSVRAVGLTTLVYGLFQTMCFTAIDPVLDALNATLVTSAAR